MIEHLKKELAGLDAQRIIQYLNEKFADKAVFSTSFGIEDQVITHILASENASVQLFTLETGRLFPETYYVMDCFGKFNLHRFMNLFALLGITHSVIFDTDNYENEHADLNQLVCDSSNGFTKNIAEIPGDLEYCLGLPKCGYKDKKPQVLLYALEKGRIEAEKLDAFCRIVEGVLTEHA